MGECKYYFKCQGTKAQLQKVKKYIFESNKAYKYWQEKRYEPKQKKEFLRKFPLVVRAVGVLEWLNGYAGVLIGVDEPNVEIKDGELFFSGNEWHLASWNHLRDYAKSIGCKKVEWASEEYQDERGNLIWY